MTRSVDEEFMRLALGEAKRGLGRTSPNPCVGAIIVKDGKVIGRGYHRRAGMPHAEIEALRVTLQPVVGATMYITLEPCNHTGRTPPCSRALVSAGIARVVVGMTDPNPRVDGSGIRYLQEHGVDVTSGVLEQQCRQLNQPFIKHITTGLPWVTMKAGVSLDGRLNYQRGNAGWITGKESRAAAHRIRDRVDAILVGRGTVAVDNPSLTTRLVGRRGKDPLRVVVDSTLSLPITSTIYHLNSPAPTWVFCGPDLPLSRVTPLQELGVVVRPVDRHDSGLDLHQILETLGGEGVCSLLVEGGGSIHGSFLRAGLVDFAHLFYAPLFAGDGGEPLLREFRVGGQEFAPRLSGVIRQRLGEDLLVSGRLAYRAAPFE